MFSFFRPIRWFLKILTGLACAWVAGFALFLFSIPHDQPQTGTVDAIVVLTGGGDRIQAGFDLLSRGQGKKLLISGVNPATGVADLQRLLLEETGKPVPLEQIQCCVTLGYAAQDTAGNASETASWARRESIRSFYLVTADYHMPRSLIEFRHQMPELEIRPYPVRPPATAHSSWLAKDTIKLLVGEYHKFIAAWLGNSGR